jgi:hypothetical protein
MLDLNDFRYFVRIVECGGVTAASRNLNEPKSTVSHRLQQLETALGIRLVNRTSRSLGMTDAGDLTSSSESSRLGTRRSSWARKPSPPPSPLATPSCSSPTCRRRSSAA